MNKLQVEKTHDGALLQILLSSPKGNVIDGEMMQELMGVFEAHGKDPALRAIVFEGDGKHFSFGASVEEHRPAQVKGMLEGFHQLFRHMLAMSVPTIAVVRGQCLGGGLELASFCTWLFASDNAVFGQPEIKLGVFAPMASIVLPWRIGAGRGLDLLISGRSIDAQEAKAIGLVHDVCEDPKKSATGFFESQLLPKSASSLRFAERAVRHALKRQVDDGLAAIERLYLEDLMHTPDAVEGIEAFIQKRDPKWTA